MACTPSARRPLSAVSCSAMDPQLKYYAKGTQPDRDIGALFEPDSRTFDYVDWIARLTSHIPDKDCQMIHYFAAYSNAHRGKEAKAESAPHPDGCAFLSRYAKSTPFSANAVRSVFCHRCAP